MTRDEIVTALRCCAEGECHGCTIYNDKQSCQERVLDAAADLIENQQRHIEALMKANDSLKDAAVKNFIPQETSSVARIVRQSIDTTTQTGKRILKMAILFITLEGTTSEGTPKNTGWLRKK